MSKLYDLKGLLIKYPVKLSSRREIENVYVDGPRTVLKLVVKEIGEVTKLQTIHGKRDHVSITFTGSDPTLEVMGDAWAGHVQTFLKVCGIGSALMISFVPKPSNAGMFENNETWVIRLNTEVRISDIPRGDETPEKKGSTRMPLKRRATSGGEKCSKKKAVDGKTTEEGDAKTTARRASHGSSGSGSKPRDVDMDATAGPSKPRDVNEDAAGPYDEDSEIEGGSLSQLYKPGPIHEDESDESEESDE